MNRPELPSILATTNRGKADEYTRIFRDVGMENMEINPLTERISPLELQDIDPSVVAAAKAVSAFHLLGKPAFVEDTGLHINGMNTDPKLKNLNGYPGAYYRQFESALGIEGILRSIDTDEYNRRARAVVAIAFTSEDGKLVHIARGVADGWIPLQPQGKNGFGFDPIFRPKMIGDSENRDHLTYAEMPPAMKDKVSMRRLALRSLLDGDFETIAAPAIK